ncbi:MAG: DMT family transporter [Candidatus Pacebacteria bacterium]|nr:DMT family transporter [Candidatus Paceibacterota bacterium]
MTWFFLSLFALSMFIAYDVLSRKFGVQTKNPRVFAALYNAVCTVLSLFLFIGDRPTMPQFSAVLFVLLFLNLSVWAIFGRVEYVVHKHVEASTLSILLQLAPALSFLFSVFFLKEQITGAKIIGISLLLLVNIWIVTLVQKGKTKLDFGIQYAIFLVLLLSIGWVLDKVVSPHLGVALFTFLSFFSPALFCGLFPKISMDDIRQELRQVPMKYIVTLASVNVLGYAAFIMALTLGEASRVIPIAISVTPFVVLLSAWLLHERSHMKEKWLASCITLFAMFLLR